MHQVVLLAEQRAQFSIWQGQWKQSHSQRQCSWCGADMIANIVLPTMIKAKWPNGSI
jgi:hypothetical protein